jgi:hypothetical protein
MSMGWTITLRRFRHSVQISAYSGVRDSELRHQCDEHVKEEEEGAKFRCNACQKLFKARNFIDKHLLNKHPELLQPDVLLKVRLSAALGLDSQPGVFRCNTSTTSCWTQAESSRTCLNRVSTVDLPRPCRCWRPCTAA